MQAEVEVAGLGWASAGGIGRGRRPGGFSREAGPLPAIRRKDVFSTPFPRFGRLDEFSRIGLAAISLALRDADLDSWQEKRPYALIAASVYGCLATDARYFATVLPAGGREASPNLFAYTLPNSFLGEAAIRFGLSGPACVLNDPAGDGLTALALAMSMVAGGEAGAAVAGVCDVARPDFLGPDGRPDRPGAVFLVLRPAGNRQDFLARLGLDGRGGVLLRGDRVADMESLVAGILHLPGAGPHGQRSTVIL